MREHSRDYGRLEDILKYARNVLTKCQTLCEHFVSIILTPRVTQENVVERRYVRSSTWRQSWD